MGAFHLSKWYLDCITDDGSAVIGYWARLGWRSLAIDYAAALVAPVGAEPRQVHSLGSPPPPVLTGRQCVWRCEPLHLEGHWEASAEPVKQDLLRSPAGEIRWHCHQPRAGARVAIPGLGEISGLGYVEELELTMAPWQLPFNELYWGRFLSPDHALVWLEWRGETRKRFAVLDGAIREDTEVTELSLDAGRPLREGLIAATVLGAVPGLVSLLPGGFRRAHESKRLSRGELRLPGQTPSRGWSIHEVVTW